MLGTIFAGTRKSPAAGTGGGDWIEWNGGPGDVDFSDGCSVENMVSPGAFGGSSNGAGMRWRAPKPRVQPRAPWPPQVLFGVMSTGLVTLYS